MIALSNHTVLCKQNNGLVKNWSSENWRLVLQEKKLLFNEVIPVQLININYGNKIAVEQYAVMLERQDRIDCFSINLQISHSTFFNYRQHSTESHLGSHIRLAVRYLN